MLCTKSRAGKKLVDKLITAEIYDRIGFVIIKRKILLKERTEDLGMFYLIVDFS